MRDIKNLTLKDLENWLIPIGYAKYGAEKPYKALQVFTWVFNKGIGSFDAMTDVSKELRERLKENFYISQPDIIASEKAKDGTIKLLLELKDKNCIECVLIPEEKRLTLCISTQVGCPLRCSFCATGEGGFTRNLQLSEIVNQVIAGRSILSPDQKITNIVLMGMGEPLLNYDEVVKFLNIATHQKGFGFAPRRVTVSTAGIAPMIERLGKDTMINIAVSLNAATDEVRNQLMPVNIKYPLKALLNACRKYPVTRNRYITIEYILLEAVNDSPEDARRLVKLLKGMKLKINLIPFNPFPGSAFKRPSNQAVLRFQKILLDNNYVAIIRMSKGRDISAACGQLKGKLQK